MPYSDNTVEIEELFNSIRSGDASSLARGITLIESTSAPHQHMAGELLQKCLPFTGESTRIGITGSPGVGKSTFINAFGEFLIEQENKKVAVLAIDPSSSISGGSILGDKTRMQDLAASKNAFIRPSPSGGDLGGVAAHTRESILLCEAAGYDLVLVETVGVGQSETAVHQMVDFFLLLILPGAGDDLQGIKRGIVEMADAIVVNKADGDNVNKAKQAKGFYQQALGLSHGQRKVEVEVISSTEKKGLDHVWDLISNYRIEETQNGGWKNKRADQNVNWFQNHLEQVGRRQVLNHPDLKKLRGEVIDEIKAGRRHPLNAAEEIITKLFSR